MKRLRILVEDDRYEIPLVDAHVEALSMEIKHDIERVRSNPRMAAALAGASPQELLDLPGETITDLHIGSTITLRVEAPYGSTPRSHAAMPGEKTT